MSSHPDSVFAPATRRAAFAYRHARVIHAGKLALALLIAAVLHTVKPMPHFIWCMVTIIIIMMSLPQVGATVEKALMRTVGTLVGAAWGVLLVTAIGDYRLMLVPMLASVAFLCHRSGGRYSYGYLVAGITIIIVTGDASHDGPAEALWRTANILAGCFIAAGVSLFVLPIRAKQDWREQLGASLDAMAGSLDACGAAGEPPRETTLRPMLRRGAEAVAHQKKLLGSLEWESRTLKARSATLAEIAEQQARAFTLLELLLLTDWKDGEDVSDPEVRELTGIIARRLAGMAATVRGHDDLLPATQEPLAGVARRRIRAALDGREAHPFAVNGYCWLLQQLAGTVDALRANLHRLDEPAAPAR